LEYDLQHELGIDILEFFRAQRPWPQLLRYAERLPDHGHYKVAIRQDDELARRQAEAEEAEGEQKPGKPTVDAHTWTPERAALTDVADILLGIRASLEAQRTGKQQRPDPMPRPRLARDRVEAARAFERHQQRVRMMLGR
jgi:hypothetical protein